ncbi:MAG: ERCC4 domain-containing protein [Ruminococcus sp.]|nr:ERCC4 domain-containing protein [Ruminococcus sp.]
MHPVEIQKCLETIKILVDTREQPTKAYKQRIKSMGIPSERRKLDFGDYSICCTLTNGEEYSLEKNVCVERKMSFDEICNCYCQHRKRFTREFERAKQADAKVYLLIENATWESAYDGDYRSKMSPSALVASMTAWLARYNCQIIFCKPKTTGKLIKELLYRELKERLENEEINI